MCVYVGDLIVCCALCVMRSVCVGLMCAPLSLSLLRALSLSCALFSVSVAGFFFGLRAVLAGGLLLSVLLLFVRLGTELNHLRNH